MFRPFDLPIPPLPVPIPGVPGTPSIPNVPLPGLPKIDTCLCKLNFSVNNKTNSPVGLTRSTFTYIVQADWCIQAYQALFQELTVNITYAPNVPPIQVTLHAPDWIVYVQAEFRDANSYWLPGGSYTFTAQIVDWKLIGGVSIPDLAVPDAVQLGKDTVQKVQQNIPSQQIKDVLEQRGKALLQRGVGEIQNLTGIRPDFPVPTPQTPVFTPPVSLYPTPDVPGVQPSVPPTPDVPSVPNVQPPSLPGVGPPQPNQFILQSHQFGTIKLSAITDAVKRNTTLFPPSSFTADVEKQPSSLHVAIDQYFTDEIPVLHVLLTSLRDSQEDRLQGTVVTSYTNKKAQAVERLITTTGYNSKLPVDEAGRASVNIGDTESDFKYGTYTLHVSFDGNEIVAPNKKVATCLSVDGDVVLTVNRRPTTLMANVVLTPPGTVPPPVAAIPTKSPTAT